MKRDLSILVNKLNKLATLTANLYTDIESCYRYDDNGRLFAYGYFPMNIAAGEEGTAGRPYHHQCYEIGSSMCAFHRQFFYDAYNGHQIDVGDIVDDLIKYLNTPFVSESANKNDPHTVPDLIYARLQEIKSLALEVQKLYSSCLKKSDEEFKKSRDICSAEYIYKIARICQRDWEIRQNHFIETINASIGPDNVNTNQLKDKRHEINALVRMTTDFNRSFFISSYTISLDKNGCKSTPHLPKYSQRIEKLRDYLSTHFDKETLRAFIETAHELNLEDAPLHVLLHQSGFWQSHLRQHKSAFKGVAADINARGQTPK